MWLTHMGRPAFCLTNDSTLIGRAINCDVRLSLPEVSRLHCRIDRTADGWMVIDLASLNGVNVNGLRISEPTPLKHEDVVQIGPFAFDVDMTLAVPAKAA